MSQPSTRINKYLPAAVVYFFLNGFLLPTGILYTTLLTPLLLLWVARYSNINYFLIFLLLLTPFVIAHGIDGIEDKKFYLTSIGLSFTVFVFCVAFYQYLTQCHTLRTIFKNILLINAFMVLVSLVFLFLPSVRPVFWMGNTMSLGSHNFQRLKMLTYEPSYYSTLFAPIAIYYLLKVFRRELPAPALYCVLVLVPLILSLSFGVILGIALTFLALLILHARKLIFRLKNIKYIFGGAALLVTVLVVLVVFFPDNVFFRRIHNILAGYDTSFNGRTMDSFILSMEIARRKSLIWGVGFGQIKVLGLYLYRAFYHYGLFTIHDVAIPNSIGDILGTLGLLGVGLKFYLEIYFFFRTKVFSNYYRLALFVFIFIYQFTGSFISNIAEYAIWIMAFKPDLFPEFNKQSSISPTPVRPTADPALTPVP